MDRLFLKKTVFKSIILTVFFSFSASGDEYDDFLIKQSNDFLAHEYNLIAPTTPETLIENWKQIRGIDQLTYLYKSDIALFRRTLAKPYMLHKWSSIRMPFEMLNHEDPVVASLAGMVKTYRYFLIVRLNDGGSRPYQGGVYSEVNTLVEMSGEKLARIIDQKYTDGKLILPKDDISLFDLLESAKGVSRNAKGVSRNIN